MRTRATIGITTDDLVRCGEFHTAHPDGSRSLQFLGRSDVGLCVYAESSFDLRRVADWATEQADKWDADLRVEGAA